LNSQSFATIKLINFKIEKNFRLTNSKPWQEEKSFVAGAFANSAVRVAAIFDSFPFHSLINIDTFSYTLKLPPSSNKLRLSIVFPFGECKQKILFMAQRL
jgi:hypothetical protein